MSVAANVISAVIKSVVGDKVGDGLAKELADISIDGISENGIDKINDFVSGKKAKMEHILSKESMRTMNIPENTIDHVVEEIKDLFKNIEITDEVLRQCKFDSMNLSAFLWNEYCGYKCDGYIECESEIKRCLFTVAEVLIKLVLESETFQQDVSIHISNSVDDINIGLQKISEYKEDNFDKLDADHQIILDILRMILEQTKNFNIQNIDKENTKFQNNMKEDYIKIWNSRMFLHQDNKKRPITLADAFVMPDCKMYKSIKRIGFSAKDTLDKIIDKFIKYDKTSTMLITGVPGIGKSSIVSWIANEHQYDDEVIILRFRDWEKEELKDGFMKAICRTLGCRKKDLENKTMVLDGFDELKLLKQSDFMLESFIAEINDLYKFKCIITSRPAYIKMTHFKNVLSVLPFGINKIMEFYEKITNEMFHYGKINSDNLEVLGIPVILYMAIVSEINISECRSKAELYCCIFAEEGGIFDKFSNEDAEYDNGWQVFRNPKNIKIYLEFLRNISFEMFEKNNLSLLKEECKIPNVENGKEKLSILEFPIKHFFESVVTNVEFIHKSIYEFFVSEYIFWSVSKKLNRPEDKMARKLGNIFLTKIVDKEIFEFLAYRIRGSVVFQEKLNYIVNTFEKMMQNGMTYYADKKKENIIECEMKTFSNMLRMLHLWEFDFLDINNELMSYYLHIYNDFLNVVLDLSKLNLSGIELKGVYLNGIKFNGSKLEKAILQGASLKRALLKGSILCGANLSKADLSKADLKRADLRGANLREARLWKADLKGADLRGAKLRGINFAEAKLKRAILSENQVIHLKSACNLCGIRVEVNGSNKLLDYNEYLKIRK